MTSVACGSIRRCWLTLAPAGTDKVIPGEGKFMNKSSCGRGNLLRLTLAVVFLTSFWIFLLALLPGKKVLAAGAPAAPQCSIVYDFGGGRTYTVTPELAMTMMVTNADGSYYIDPATGYYVCDSNKMRSFFSGLQQMYPYENSVPNQAGFQTTLGNYIALDGSFQKTGYLDVDYEINYLATAIMEQRTEQHTPVYRCGGTYVEIDISNQILYYYENGVCRFTTSVVTGNHSTGHDTPTGVYCVLGKQRNVTLKGKDYASFVQYWMNFIGNSVGLHDASWRSRFGGSIYLTNGSHGCVNIPPSVMPELYGMVSVGTTVVLY